jgi:hypothetical protein
MVRSQGLRKVLFTLLPLLVVVGGLALGAEATLDQLAQPQLSPSPLADLLGPITEAGRTGWKCTPERAASAHAARAAELPSDQP